MSAPDRPFRLLAGLGNPGAEYAGTRHNVGFMVLDQMAAAARISFSKEKAWQAQIAKCGPLLLCKPMTYMNLSGQAVRALSDFYRLAPAEILVVLDDMALPLGRLRLRPGGSAGGHNGLTSVIEHLGTPEIPRLRIGIGAADPGAAVSHVLGQFAPAEREPLAASLERAMAAIETAQTQGLAAAMNAFN